MSQHLPVLIEGIRVQRHALRVRRDVEVVQRASEAGLGRVEDGDGLGYVLVLVLEESVLPGRDGNLNWRVACIKVDASIALRLRLLDSDGFGGDDVAVLCTWMGMMVEVEEDLLRLSIGSVWSEERHGAVVFLIENFEEIGSRERKSVDVIVTRGLDER